MKYTAESSKRKYVIGVVVVVVITGTWIFFSQRGGNAPERTITVLRGSITQEVIVTGKIRPKDDIELGFEKSGTVANIYAHVGTRVARGTILVSLDTRELTAAVDQAEANKTVALARLEALNRGPRDEDITIAQTSLEKEEQDLSNIFNGVPDVLHDAYSKTDDTVRKQLDPLFINDEHTNAALSFEANSTQTTTDASSLRAITGDNLTAWGRELTSITSSTSNEVLESMLLKSRAYLMTTRRLLDKTMEAVTGAASSLDPATALIYKSYVATGRTSIDTALSNINGEVESIATQKIDVAQKKSELDLKLAGSDPQDITAQEATVSQLDAALRTTQIQLEKSVLRSPLNGIVTRQDSKVGALVTANQSIISIISNGALQIESNVAEVDIAKMEVGNSAMVTLDAYGNDIIFSAIIISIDPAATIIEGVPTYKATFSLDKEDARIKPGMTANVNLIIGIKKDVLVIPQRAVREINGKRFVSVILSDGGIEDREITTGLRGSEGNVEIISGLSEGDNIVAYSQ
ncbi:MAG: efflux RND transporter periplasmic adaptor subunit [Patescibacteria group bacterium]|nr:efflux RND transporter periplasmic adaptor subunit [Patescibacteria group bacterium]